MQRGAYVPGVSYTQIGENGGNGENAPHQASGLNEMPGRGLPRLTFTT